MKVLTIISAVILSAVILLTGCGALSTNDYQHYVDSQKSMSKDSTVAQTACWNAVIEIAKGGDNAAKVGAIALAEKCKNAVPQIEAPKKSFFSF